MKNVECIGNNSQRQAGVQEKKGSEHAPSLLHPTFLSDRLREWGKEAAADLLEEAAEPEGHRVERHPR